MKANVAEHSVVIPSELFVVPSSAQRGDRRFQLGHQHPRPGRTVVYPGSRVPRRRWLIVRPGGASVEPAAFGMANKRAA